MSASTPSGPPSSSNGVSDNLQVKSWAHGCIYDMELRFIVHCLAQNLRSGPQALIGSDVQGDVSPGLYQMIGDVRYLLGGCQLGLDPGVKFTDVTGEARIIESDLAQRVFRPSSTSSSRARYTSSMRDLFPSPEVWVQRRDAGTPPGLPFDPGNYVAQGLCFGPQHGLVAAPAAGIAYLSGQLVSSEPGAHSFVAEADTYRDLSPDGAISYTAVEVDSDPPPQRPGTLRVGVTRTTDTSIVSDAYLCSYSVPSSADPGDPSGPPDAPTRRKLHDSPEYRAARPRAPEQPLCARPARGGPLRPVSCAGGPALSLG